jgi:hypothetical protein
MGHSMWGRRSSLLPLLVVFSRALSGSLSLVYLDFLAGYAVEAM